jgi:hypothetical protein
MAFKTIKAFQVSDVHIYGRFRNPYAKLDAPRPERARDRRAGMSKTHLENIRQLQCTICCATAPSVIIDAHHLKSGAAATERGIGLKATDRRTIPLCREHHMFVERFGSRRERAVIIDACGIDPHHLSDALWRQSSDKDREKSVDNMRAVLTRFQLEGIRMLSARDQAERLEARRS